MIKSHIQLDFLMTSKEDSKQIFFKFPPKKLHHGATIELREPHLNVAAAHVVFVALQCQVSVFRVDEAN